jgi:probable addiction module antidote protein
MRARIKVHELPAFDAAPYLDSDEAIAAYLTDILQANDAGLLSAALGDIARARGMTDIAKAAGITREALYKALRPGSAPRFDTVNRVCTALGVRLVVQPLDPADGSTAFRCALESGFDDRLAKPQQTQGTRPDWEARRGGSR